MSSRLSKQVQSSTVNKNNWQEKKKKLHEQFPHLSDFDLSLDDGRTEEMINKLHAKISKTLGKSRDALHKFIKPN